jgi:hypothetical protein
MAFLELIPEAFAGLGEAFAGVSESIGVAGVEAAETTETLAPGGGEAELGEGGRALKEVKGHTDRQEVHTQHVHVYKTVDRTRELFDMLKKAVQERVLVGIPAQNDPRSAPSGPINNATIGIIMERGSPGRNIPARPWLVPGVRSARAQIGARYRAAARDALKTMSSDPIMRANRIVGQETADAVKRYIKTGSFAPLSPKTVAARARQRAARNRRASEIKYLKAVKAGMPLVKAQNLYGIRPLINTGQLLGSVTYVIRPRSTRKGTVILHA